MALDMAPSHPASVTTSLNDRIQTLDDRIQNLAQELQDEIFTKYLALAASTDNVQVVPGYKPPIQLTINRSTRTKLRPHYYARVFDFNGYSPLKAVCEKFKGKWVRSFLIPTSR